MTQEDEIFRRLKRITFEEVLQQEGIKFIRHLHSNQILQYSNDIYPHCFKDINGIAKRNGWTLQELIAEIQRRKNNV